MVLKVVDLTAVSDDEDESPNKAARSALDSFAPRKDKWTGRSADAPGRQGEGEDDLTEKAARSALSSFGPGKDWAFTTSQRVEQQEQVMSPTGATRSSLSAFQPRKDRLSGSGRPVDRPRQSNAKSPDEALYKRTNVLGSGLGGLPATRPPDRPISGQAPTPRIQHLAAETVSLAALLQISQKEGQSQARAVVKQAEKVTSPSLSPLPSTYERTRRAEEYYRQYVNRNPGDVVPFPLASPKAASPSIASKKNESPRFKFPTGWAHASKPGQSSATVRTAPLQIIDTFEQAENTAKPDNRFGLEARPIKRPRLLGTRPAAETSKDSGTVVAKEKANQASADKPGDSPTHLAARDTDLQSRKDDLHSPLDAPKLKGAATPTIKDTLFQSPASRPSSKKGARPFHLRHQTRLKPATDDLTSRISPQPAAQGRGDISANKPALSPLAQPAKEVSSTVPCREPLDIVLTPVAETPARSTKASAISATKTSTRLASGGEGPTRVADELRDDAPAAPAPTPAPRSRVSGKGSHFGAQYIQEEDALLAELKEVRGVKWDDMPKYFQGRTRGSLQTRYSSVVSKRNLNSNKLAQLKQVNHLKTTRAEDSSDSEAPQRRKRKRNNEASAASGMVSWAEVKRRRQMLEEEETEASEPAPANSSGQTQFLGERAHPMSLSRTLRQRELGFSGRRANNSIQNEMKEQIFDNVGPLMYHKGTSGDVTCLAWSSNGRHFAAGSIAISDERSMQYNRPGNLIVGDAACHRLEELPEHHITRPSVTAKGHVNGLHAMRETQDSRLFMTVATVQFSPDGSTLYSAGTDSTVRAYDVNAGETVCDYEIVHPASLDLLSVSNINLLATACHQSTDDSINIYNGQEHLKALSPSRAEQQTSRAIFPSALRWGIHHYHSNLLLAGFSIDSYDEERGIAGETCLWDLREERAINLPVTRNVFDVAWNPRPTSTSTTFAIAGTPTSKVCKGTKTVVQCFAPNQGRASKVLEWECPAFDINDVVYCQHDDNLIAAGATNGNVYVWDQRYRGRTPKPLHVLEHSDSLNVLDHDRPREIADTGIRFLSWGATSSRLYSGSSDGVVKIWNPYMATESAHVKDVATFSSAVMSGAFSPDYRDLLIGEDQGRINSLSVGHGEKAVRSMRKFHFVSAPAPQPRQDRHEAAHELLKSQQIMLRPMGDLPVRQAVQGPEYAGPYLQPTIDEISEAKHAFEVAVQAQKDAKLRADMLDDDEHSQLSKAHQQLTEAKEAVEKLNSRIRDGDELHPQAEAFQRRLSQAQKQRLQLEASLAHELVSCKLDCNYLPANADDDGEVADSGRAEGMIPGNLGGLPPQDTTSWTRDELAEAGLTRKCIACSGPAAKPKTGFPLCASCAATRRGLTAKCAECSRPIRPQSESGLCENCSFACFRCGESAHIWRNKSLISCKKCKLAWKAGVLGYELAESSKKHRIGKRRRLPAAGEGALDFGEDEMERFAARWGDGS